MKYGCFRILGIYGSVKIQKHIKTKECHVDLKVLSI